MMAKTMSRSIVDWDAFGKWVGECQSALNISDRELAKRAGLSATYVGDIKRGKTGLTDKSFSAIVIALGSTESEAKMAMQIERPDLTSEEQEVLQTYRRVPEQEKPRFLTIVKATGQALTTC